MPLKKRHLCSEIALILSSGLLLTAISSTAQAQLPQVSCRANDTGDGWICDENPTSGTSNTIRTTTRPLNNRRDRAGRSDPAPGSAQTSQQAPELSADSPKPDDNEPTVLTASNTSQRYELDWIPLESLSAEQLTELDGNCCGAFVDPIGIKKDNTNRPADSETRFDTEQGIRNISQNLISIDGDIIVQQGYRTIENDESTTIDSEENTVLMQGDVIFREPGVMLRGSSAFIDNNAGNNRVEDAQYVLHDLGAHGNAESIAYSSNTGSVTIENGEFSRCEPESRFWLFRAKSIVLNQDEGVGYATAVSLRIKDVPIFYYPGTLPFPLGDERMSGFLAPSTGSTRSGGFDFELPYYFNLAPQYDATLSPRLISDRGVLTGLELRYLAETSLNTLNMSYLGNDKLFDETTANVLGSDSPPTDNRWFIGYEHYGVYGRNWSSFVDYNAVSDEDYFYDLGSNGLNTTSRTHLNRQARLNFNTEYLRAGLNVQRIQIIDPLISSINLNRPYDRLPQFYFDTDAYLGAGFRVELGGQVTSFDRTLDESLLSTTQLDNGALVHGERLNLEPAISWSVEQPGWFLRANAKFKHASYKLQNQATTSMDDPNIGINVYNLDGGLIFERPMSGGFTQTLEPRAYYLFSEFEDQSMLPLFDTSELNFSFSQLFREDRFSGGDRIGDADQASIAITSRILDEKGKERARMSLGQIRYFDDRQVDLSNPIQSWIPRYSPLNQKSALAGEFALSFGESWRLNTDVQYNEETEELDEGSFQLRYHRDNDHLFNLAYRYRNLVNSPNFILPTGIDPRIKQTDLSAVWPINQTWKLLARWNYDHSNSRNLETFAGVEYSNCCATIRVIAREWVDEDELFVPNIEPNQGIFVQFTLNGLGNITGGGISSLLSDGIRGFRENDDE
ncbi:MAG: LPS-assembly protein LptD [Proteobacteria bacterium]|nr:LPS-assembly protein LptD [Pseudomonadota bacterium]MDA1291176.1 LPS-assembly protein LptD [Pseudomonadota bacterium]